MGELIDIYTNISKMGLILIAIFTIVVMIIVLATLNRVAFVFMQEIIKDDKKCNKFFYLIWVIIIFVFIIFGYSNAEKYLIKAEKLQNELRASKNVEIYGLIYDVEEKEKSIYVYINEVCIKLCDGREIEADKILLIKYLNESEKIKKIEDDVLEDYMINISKNLTDSVEDINKIQVGKYISAKGEYKEYREVRNEGGFDEEKYYLSIGIKGKVAISEYLIFEENNIFEKIWNKLFTLKNKLMDRLDEIAKEKYSAIYKGILLGDKSYIDENTLNLYKVSGILHILSISGLHISLIGYFLYKLLRKNMGFLFSGIFSFVIIYLYSVMIGAGFSTKRAVIMFAVSILGNLIGRSYDLLSALFLVGIIIVVDNPIAIYNSGMLLSFVAIIGIEPMSKLISKLLGCKNKFINSFFSSLSINVVTMPIVINSYYEVSMYSVFINVLILGIARYMVGFGFIGLLASLANVNLGKIIIYPGCLILKFYEFVCENVAGLDGAVKVVSHRSIERICIYYFVMVFILIVYLILIKNNYFEKKFVKKIRYFLVVVNFFILFVVLVYSSDNDSSIKMIDVGQGDSIFIKDEGVNILIDAGSSSESELVKYTIIPFLKYNGVSKLDYLILTHSDSDHGGSFVELLIYKINGESLVKNLVLPDIADYLKDDLYIKIEETAKKEKINIIYFSRGMSLKYYDSSIECLWPIKKDGSMDKNSLSIVFEYRKKDFSMLFTGDLTKEGEREIIDLQGNKKLEVDVLKVGHHGSKDSSSLEFLELVSPRLSLISCGKGNSYGHPHQETIERLRKIGCEIWNTSEVGQITINKNKEGIPTKIRNCVN